MKYQLFMGVDIGTSGVRAALFDRDGRQVCLYHKEYPLLCSGQGAAELEPEDVLESLVEVVGLCTKSYPPEKADIEAIGLSTQMHSFLAVDRDGNCLTRVMTWADTRPKKQGEHIGKNFDFVHLYERTGCRVQHPMYPLSKILWLKEEQPEIYEKADKFVTIKEYILYRLFGEFVIDITDASATGCFNIHKFQWDEEILGDIIKTGSSRFGKPVECTYVLKNMRAGYAERMGVREDIPVVAGSGDGIMANVGCGVFDDRAMSSTIGTSGALRIAVDKPLADPRQGTWCYCFTRDTWVAGGAINNGGIVLRWLRDEFRQQYEYEMRAAGEKSIYGLFDRYAAETAAGSEGLFFLPYLAGERSPGWNADAKGTIHGLRLFHGKKHLIRAAMEGVIYKMFSVYEAIARLNGNVERIMGNGGYVNSDIWLQIQADVFNKEIAVAGIGEAAVFGAAYTAMAAVGAVKNLKQPLPAMQPSRIVKPIEENARVYKEAYKNYRRLYSVLVGQG